MRERTVPLTKSHTDTPERVVSVFLAVIQGFMKPVFAKAKMGFVETAEKGTFSDREVGSEQKTSGNRISGRSFAKRTVPLTKIYGHTLTGRVRFFIAIQGFMKPVFAKAKMGFVAAAAKARQPLRTVESGAHAIFRKTPAAFEKCGSAPSP